MSDNSLVKFEVYAMQGERWNIHAHFVSSDLDGAIQEARIVERQTSITAACVMRASYDPNTNTSSDTVIYHSPSLHNKPSASSLSKGGGGGKRGAILSPTGETLAPPGSAAANAAADYKRRNKEFLEKQRQEASISRAASELRTPDFPYADKKKGSRLDIIKLSAVFLVSGIIATTAAWAVFLAVRWLDLMIERDVMLLILASTFGIIFLMLFIPMVKKIVQESKNTRRVLKKETQATVKIAEPNKILTPPKLSKGTPELTEPNKILTPQKASEAPPELAEEIESPSTEVESDISEEEPFDLEEEADDASAEKTLNAKPEEDDDFFPENSEDNMEESDDLAAPDGEDEKPPQVEEENTSPDALKTLLFTLVNEVNGKYGTDLKEDAYLRFGAILFLAGAVEVMARKFGIGKKTYLQMLVTAVTEIGAEPDHAQGFCANIDEYLLDERYLEMFSAGRNAGGAKLKSADAKSGFIDWIEYWRNPAIQTASKNNSNQSDKSSGKHFIAILFTDIVDFTTKMDDEWMMQAVRLHNQVVREALKNYNGREIKHLGDGIMASFPAVSEAVAASIAMQRGFKETCARDPNYQFDVRIGISAGEPIHESGDIFGTPVNLAARVMGKAGGGQIAVPSVVKDMCLGQSFEFSEIGKVKLKGFSEIQMIYQVNWT